MSPKNVTIEQIRAAFKFPLPGFEGQIKLAPEFRIKELGRPQPSNAKTAGVLLLLYKYQDCFHFPLIRRMYNARDRHSGEVSLPGGSQDSNESIQETALRETEEEIGVVRDKINVLGTLSPMYIPPSNFLVTPTVAEIDYRPDFQCNRNEVAELFEVPLSLLPRISQMNFQVSAGQI